MKRRIAMIAAFSAVLGLSACGGSDDYSVPKVFDASALVKTDTAVGTGAEVPANSVVTAKYSLWLYDPAAPESKGTKMEGPATLTSSLSSLVSAWQQGVPGMKVGGKRTLVVPSSLGYGTTGKGAIPANSGLVFDIEVIAFSPVYDAPELVKTDTLLGTGDEVAAGKTVTVKYSLWLYDSTKADFKGTLIQDTAQSSFALVSPTMIAGWVEGVPGMKVGGKRTLIIPAAKAYGAAGNGPIPGNSGLVFDIEILRIP